MTMSSAPLAPSETVAEAAEYAASSPVGRTIIEETLNEGIETGNLTESGRTWCSGDEKGAYRDPIERLPAAIDLSGCPPGDLVVTWHTHTTEQQLRNPEHSLPDIANVAFGRVDVSVVPGIESDHILVGAADRDEMAAQFQNALGIEADAPGDVTDAIEDGTIFNAPSLRDRTFEVFDSLTQRVTVDRTDLQPVADDLFDPDTQSMTAEPCDGLHTIECDPTKPGGDRVRPDETTGPQAPQPSAPEELRATSVMRRESRIATAGLSAALSEYDIKTTVVGTAVGMFTSRLLERAVFGD
jgi:hypothetical protein